MYTIISTMYVCVRQVDYRGCQISNQGMLAPPYPVSRTHRRPRATYHVPRTTKYLVVAVASSSYVLPSRLPTQ